MSVYTNITVMCILIHKVSLNLFIIYTGVKTEEKRASPHGKTYSIMYIDKWAAPMAFPNTYEH